MSARDLTHWRSSTSTVTRSTSLSSIAPTSPQVSCLYAPAQRSSMGHLTASMHDFRERNPCSGRLQLWHAKSPCHIQTGTYSQPLGCMAGKACRKAVRTHSTIINESRKNMLLMMNVGIFRRSGFPSTGIPTSERYRSTSLCPVGPGSPRPV